MNERTERAAVADLLSAIVAALDVPLPALAEADERAYHRILQRRASDVRIVLRVMLRHRGDGDLWESASEIRHRTAEEPVSYTPFVFKDGSTS
ncbi:hypothetical protein Snoj_44120 [Streptomyces nojiriensis]|uniref:Uncharacterized protein n=1 Tax=Streptomyces nojiriensis TaxID=66374 RepID=A0ABQ3SQS0_9ACTN|nr:hypothetical protein [Streptomyces nojiriensis]QTI44025.1 hypothetical protein JYK04_01788 [Streptomyces nojiriensis]QTI44043.1 hypothetical protein JYK04_01806 [Streptomyces nojiriensis]GGR85705.1 hypothetical protein GCM10010205_12780 [Streptomyces nojiriensis]GHI70494.1 hypothetical protein Snoj_44120 [Streptomyces nojiriensis]